MVVESANVDQNKSMDPVREKCSFLLETEMFRVVNERGPLLILAFMINIAHLIIHFTVQGISARAVHVRSYWRVQNGRKVFVKAHWRKR